MRLLVDIDPATPALGLATDDVLLDSVRHGAEDVLRLWVNDRSVVVGRSQSVSDEVDLAAAERRGVPVLRRVSGGGTVYHYPGNLNVSIILSRGARLGSAAEVFRRLGGLMGKGLEGMCPDVRCEENDLRILASKVGGAAQARRGDALLYHTTVLVRPEVFSLEELLLAMRPGYRPRSVASRPRATVSLAEATGMDRTVEAIAHRLEGELLHDPLFETAVPGRLDGDEQRCVLWLAASKYGDSTWNRYR